MKIVEARGSFREVGQKVGEHTREEIAFMRDFFLPEMLKESFGGDELRMHRDGRRHLWYADMLWPEAGQYARGLAEGASLGLDHMLPIVFMDEMPVPLPRDRCSTLLVRSEDEWLIGHQEDFPDVFYGKVAALDLTFTGHPRIVSLNYPGTFPGMAASLNASGVAMTCNALWLDPVPGLGKQVKHFLAAMQPHFYKAVEWICHGPHILADHFLVVGGEEDVAASIEVTSHPDAKSLTRGTKNIAEIREIVWDRKGEDGYSVAAPFTHANHIKWLEPWVGGIIKDPAHHGSMMRQRKLERICAECLPEDAGEMLDLLTEKDGVLNRNAENNKTGQPRSVTLATAVIEPSSREITMVGYGDGDEEEKIFTLS